MANAELKILYRETKSLWSEEHDTVWHAITIELRRWTNQDYAMSDTILETALTTFGEQDLFHDMRPRNETTAQAIRHAIATFDRLVAEHPNLSGAKE